MIQKIKEKILEIFSKKEKRILVENYFSLTALNALSYVFPLLTYPYLFRVIGISNFGLISFAQSLNQYFVILVDYAFQLSATHQISIHRDDSKKVSLIFNSVFFARLMLMLIALLIMIIVVFTFGKFRSDYLIYLFSFGIVISSFLFPIWFFQGMEKMKYITIIQVISRIIFTLLVFIVIKKSEDFLMVPLLNSCGGIISGIISLVIVFRVFKVKFYLPSLKDIFFQLKDGWYLFLSRVSISLYTASNTFLLGLFTNNTIVGYFAGADKIVGIVKNLIFPISDSLFPYIAKRILESKEDTMKFIKKVIPLTSFFIFLMSLILFLFAPLIVKLILGDHFEESIIVLRILSFTPFIINIGNIIGAQIMIPFGYKKQLTRIIFVAGIINIVFLLITIPFFKEIGVAISVLLVETYILIAKVLFLKKEGYDFINYRKN